MADLLFQGRTPAFPMLKYFRRFGYAIAGIIWFVVNERNARFHLASTLIVIFLGWYARVSHTEWIALIFAIAMVWVAEMLNTAVEKTMDFISQRTHYRIRIVKDVAAGAVLIASVAALCIACFVFIPKFI
jgi:diacylglycerol kinase